MAVWSTEMGTSTSTSENRVPIHAMIAAGKPGSRRSRIARSTTARSSMARATSSGRSETSLSPMRKVTGESTRRRS